MLILVKIISIIIVIKGIIFLLSPKLMRKCMAFWGQGKRLYVGAALSILFGVIFLLAASQCKLVWVIIALGIWSLVKGIIIFIRGLEKTKAILKWWGERSARTVQFIALIVIAIGASLLYSI